MSHKKIRIVKSIIESWYWLQYHILPKSLARKLNEASKRIADDELELEKLLDAAYEADPDWYIYQENLIMENVISNKTAST